MSVALGVGVFALVVLGGKVTSYDAGMAVPDWPGTFGRQMFLAPIEDWAYDPATGEFFQGPFFEHSHRLLGAAAGLLSIAQVVAVWRARPVRPVLRWASVALLGLIISQGLMGGFRVSEQSVFLAGVHGVAGQLILGFAVVLAGATALPQRLRDRAASVKPKGGAAEIWALTAMLLVAFVAAVLLGRQDGEAELIQWRFSAVGAVCVGAMTLWLAWSATRLAHNLRAARAASNNRTGRKPAAWAYALLGAVSLQLVLGAAVRHGQAERAIPDAPLVMGSVLPPTTPEGRAEALATMDAKLVARAQTQPELSKIWLHYAHRVGAIGVCVVVLAAAAAVGRSAAMDRRTRRWAGLALAFVGVQLALGLMTVWSNIHPLLASGHQAVGAALLATVCALAWSVHRARLVALEAESEQPIATVPAARTAVTTPEPAPRADSWPPAPAGTRSDPRVLEEVGA
ncbi:MAG: COX15/CtaA family protein [Planctomycetota bacterium]